MAQENLIDVVDRLDRIVVDLKRVVYGDADTRQPGILTQFESMTHRVDAIDRRVTKLEDRRPNIWLWILGYFGFVAAMICAMVGILNASTPANLWDMPSGLAAALALLFAVGACVMFLAGFGWFDR